MPELTAPPGGRSSASAAGLRWHDGAAVGVLAIAAVCTLAGLVGDDPATAVLAHAAAGLAAITLTWLVVRRLQRTSVRLLMVWPLLVVGCVALGSALVPHAATLTLQVLTLAFLFVGLTQARGASLPLLPAALLAQWLVIDLPPEDAAVRMSIAACVWTAVAELSAWLTSALRAARQELALQAATDPLTGLANRRSWEPRVDVLLREARSSGRPLTLLIADLDHFKAYNDQYGHLAGDELLRCFAGGLGSLLPATAAPARWGGEEFVVALPDLSGAEAHAVAERIRTSVPDRQSCSIGLATSQADDTVLSLLGRADAALYRAKDRGRDRVEAA
ncbi:MAG TPA: GGDEF domain-containing protein [Nocardioides sp.]|uniref:GGDEF domain-containing protein n=1 Tax=Nocardioides sp. TaxID=35761 RepID=UPI002EDB3392